MIETARTEAPDARTADGASTTGRRIRRVLIVLALGSGLLALYLYFRHTRDEPAAEVPAVQAAAKPLEVEVVTIEPRTVPISPRFLGQTEASLVVEIRARVRGFVVERPFDEGQHVEAGQVLVRIDPKPFEVELESASSDLASAQARLDQARQQLARYQELFSRGSVAPTELEEWQATERVASALVSQTKARIERAELDLGYTTITAPSAGVVGRVTRDVGSYVDDSANSLIAVLRRVDPIYVRYAVSEQEILRWRRLGETGRVSSPGIDRLALAITLGDGTQYPHEGRIHFVDVVVDPSTGTTVIRGTVPNPENALVPGQYVHVTVRGLEYVDTLLVPQRAVLQSATGPTVFVLDDAGTAEQRTVVLGEWVDDAWIVESGLAAGDRLVADRLMQIRSGSKLVARPAADTTAKER